MGFKKGNKIGNRFSKDNQPKKRSKNLSLYKRLEAIIGEEFGVDLRNDDYYRIIRWALERSIKTLKQLMFTEDGQVNENTPAFLICIASSIISDFENGRMSTVDSIFDRIFGKATQSIENKVNANISSTFDIDLSKLTEEQRNVLLEIGNDIINRRE